MADNTEKKPGFFKRVTGFFKRVGKFFKDTFGEMKKVAWPTKKQIIQNTIIVLVVVLAASIIIFGLDTLFGSILRWVINAF